jgi:hypothetical protein
MRPMIADTVGFRHPRLLGMSKPVADSIHHAGYR